jgi:hypothetical protein
MAQREDLPATAIAHVSGTIGAESGTIYLLHGRIAEVAVYNVALPGVEIQRHYTAAVRPPAGIQ